MPASPPPSRWSRRAASSAAALARDARRARLGCARSTDHTRIRARVTAAFLLKFVTFVDWPPDVLAPEAPLTMCLADPPVAQAVPRVSPGRPPRGPSQSCNYGRAPCRRVRRALCHRSRPTAHGHADLGPARPQCARHQRHGGLCQTRRHDSALSRSGSMKFSVNPQAAERARLHVSSLLLKLAVIVKE